MKIKHPQKSIQYFGITLCPPDRKGYIATDYTGEVTYFRSKPTFIATQGWNGSWVSSLYSAKICTVLLDSESCRDTLIHFDGNQINYYENSAINCIDK